MMDKELKLLEELNLQQRSYESFIEEFPAEVDDQYILKSLDQAVLEKNSVLFELLISLCYHYHAGFVEGTCSIFCRAITEDWHKQHEEIARIFQFKLKCECSIDSLIKAMNQKYNYLVVSGDYDSFVRKCMYAISNLKTSHSLEALNKLSNSANSIIKDHAMYQIKKCGS